MYDGSNIFPPVKVVRSQYSQRVEKSNTTSHNVRVRQDEEAPDNFAEKLGGRRLPRGLEHHKNYQSEISSCNVYDDPCNKTDNFVFEETTIQQPPLRIVRKVAAQTQKIESDLL